MIQINKIPDLVCELYDPNDNLVGVIENEYSFHDVRVQICQQQLEGYYVRWGEYDMKIDKNGRLPFWADGFQDTTNNLLIKLL